MGAQVVVGTVGHAHEFAPFTTGEPEPIFEVNGACGIVGTLLFGNVELTHIVGVNAQVDKPIPAGVHPFLEFFGGIARRHEIFDLHLFEFAGAEDEVTRGDLVAERLANLTNAEGGLHAGGGLHILKVNKDALGGFGPHIVQTLLVVDRAKESLHESGEHLRLGPGAGLAGFRVGNIGETICRRVAVLLLVGLQEVIGTIALMGMQGFHQRIGEGFHVAGGLPHLARQNNGRVKTYHVGPTLHEGAPPLLFNILFEFHAKRAVIPG